MKHKIYQLFVLPINILIILMQDFQNVEQFKKVVRKILLLKIIIQRYLYKILLCIYGKKKGNHNYTVVSAAYNVEQYIDEYFESIVNQTLDFKSHIHLVMVDDGSTDASAAIIKKWQKKYPKNISYIKKENAGQASARNLGLEQVKTEWVTFIDPDDFIDRRYFEVIERLQQENKEKDLSMLSCSFIFYLEDGCSFSDTHPLWKAFVVNDERLVRTSDMEGLIQLSSAAAFFKMSTIKKYKLKFDEKIKPSFEDGHFVGNYLLRSDNEFVAFSAKAKYFYRKRSDSSSTLDMSWKKESRFFDVLKFGYLDLIGQSNKLKGHVTKNVQKTILYDIMWHFDYLVDNVEKVAFLNEEQIIRYKLLLKEIFKYIDCDVIDEYDLENMKSYHKIAILKIFKGVNKKIQIVHIDAYDIEKCQIRIKYFGYRDNHVNLLANGNLIEQKYKKIRQRDFLGDIFINEYISWVSVENFDSISVVINTEYITIMLGDKQYKKSVSIIDIKEEFYGIDTINIPIEHILFRKIYNSQYFSKKYKDAWLFIDRDIQADDNAEHLYRYVAKNHRNINKFFVLRKNSHDWKRLKAEGFNLIAFGSVGHRAAFIHAHKLISSHAEQYVYNLLQEVYYRDLTRGKFIFLQHGIIKDDLSNWLNKQPIDCFVTSSKCEYESIVNDYTNYDITTKEVILTGLPRHDALLEKQSKSKKSKILIMPTWRSYLVNMPNKKNDKKKMKIHFIKSQYAKVWESFLNSQKLKDIAIKHHCDVVFFPHSNIQPYLSVFKIPDYIEVLTHKDVKIQELFQKAVVMITDYSSVAFEMGYLRKETIYYQFDKKSVFGGDHTYKKGYFSYEEDGFGPVSMSESDALDELDSFFCLGGGVDKKYLERMNNFYSFHDNNNCKRVYEQIEKMY